MVSEIKDFKNWLGLGMPPGQHFLIIPHVSSNLCLQIWLQIAFNSLSEGFLSNKISETSK